MGKFIVQGGNVLQGQLDVQGAKNSVLPILAGTLLQGGTSTIHNCPKLSDVNAAIKILEYLGCTVKREDSTIIVNSDNVSRYDIPDNLMREMRSSIVFLGAIVSRMKKAKLSTPGGCELGPRPIDLHILALKKLGVSIDTEYGFINCTVKDKIKGTKISLNFPSVGATENIMLSSVLGEGTTIITNAAQEPEIVDLAKFLISRGAKIHGAGDSTVFIEGVKKLHDCEHTVISDRIVATTYLCAVAITGGEILLNKVNPNDLETILPLFEEMGLDVKTGTSTIYLKGKDNYKSVKSIRTMPYPGFPTDAQAPIMAMLTKAKGTSVFVENIFENRYKHVSELSRMGADIKVEGRVCIVNGVNTLYGTSVEAQDLRGGGALIIAALGAEGETVIENIYHVDRGYEDIEQNISKINGCIKRI